jgi:hypothetical protein
MHTLRKVILDKKITDRVLIGKLIGEQKAVSGIGIPRTFT